MTIKQAFEYLESECGIGMKNPFIALRNLVEGFSKVANELDPTPTGDFVKKSGDTMTGPLVVEDGVTATKFSYEEPALGGTINLVATPSTADVDVQIPNKSGTLVLTSTVYNYTLSEKKVGSWLGEDLYQKTIKVESPVNNVRTNIDDDLTGCKVVHVEGYFTRVVPNLDNAKIIYPLNTWEEGLYFAIAWFDEYLGKLAYKVKIGNNETCGELYITIRYTKPTV